MNTTRSLEVTTPTDREIVMTRVFDASRQLVFAALTKPELLKRWMGPRDWRLAECDIDLRVGGAWRMVHVGPDGTEMGVQGVYREVSPPERLVTTEVFDEWQEAESVVTTVLVEDRGRTTVTVTSLYPSQEVRDSVVNSGMEDGVGEGFDRLDDLLALTEIGERYHKRASIFEQKVAAVKPDQWANQSPCADWTARDVVDHIVTMHGVMLQPLARPLTPAPSLASDPLRAFRSARADIEAVLDNPALAAVEVDTPMGRMAVGEHIDQVVSADMVLHGWDLSRATGQDDTIDPAELARARDALDGLPEEILRMPGVFGPALEPPPGADEQTKLLAFLGRRAW